MENCPDVSASTWGVVKKADDGIRTHNPRFTKAFGPAADPPERPIRVSGDIECDQRLGGLLKHYDRKAA
jgi:hypothetical protein